MTATEQETRKRYRSLALDWGAARDNPRKANRIFKTHHALYKKIRDQDVGRAAIEGLLTDPEPAVRMLAATHVLPFDPVRGQQVLKELEAGVGEFSQDAKHTLIAFQAGRLDLDW